MARPRGCKGWLFASPCTIALAQMPGPKTPSASAFNVRQRVAKAGMNRPGFKSGLAFAAHATFLASLKAKKWRDAACEPGPNPSGNQIFPGSPKSEAAYTCTKCGKETTLSKMRQQPCRKRNRKLGVTYFALLAKTRGKKIADNYAKRQAAKESCRVRCRRKGPGKAFARSS